MMLKQAGDTGNIFPEKGYTGSSFFLLNGSEMVVKAGHIVNILA